MRIGRRGVIEGAALVAFARHALADETLLRHGSSPQNLATPMSYFERLITDVYSLEQVEAGLRQMEKGGEVMKILVNCAGN